MEQRAARAEVVVAAGQQPKEEKNTDTYQLCKQKN
jgi:hypothetical protein